MWELFVFALILVGLYFSWTLGAPIAALVGGLVGGGAVLVEYAAAAADRFRGGAPIDGLGVEPPLPGDDSREPAYRNYFFGPVFREYGDVLATAGRRGWTRVIATDASTGGIVSRPAMCQRIATAYRDEHWIPVSMSPVPAKIVASGVFFGAIVGVAGGALAGGLIAAAVSVVFGVVLALVVLAVLAFAGLLRAVELLVLRVKGITLECRACSNHVSLPAYACPYCPPNAPSIHRRLVPGPAGIFGRTCRCGHVLPTLLARGKWALPAYCQHDGCNEALPVKGLVAPTFHVPVVAGRQAGKTVFMMAAVTGFDRRFGPAGEFEFAAPEDRDSYLAARRALEQQSFSSIRATAPELELKPFNFFLGAEGSRSRRLLYVYDAAGERYETESGLTTFRFQQHTEGVILIVDPFSFPQVSSATGADVLTGLKPSVVEPDDVRARFAEDLRRNLHAKPGRPMSVPVAVVLSKCDALLASGVAHPYDGLGDAATDEAERAARSAAVRTWLRDDVGQAGFVSALENAFNRCGYFAVSALDAFAVKVRSSGRTRIEVRNDDPATPLLWLLDADRT